MNTQQPSTISAWNEIATLTRFLFCSAEGKRRTTRSALASQGGEFSEGTKFENWQLFSRGWAWLIRVSHRRRIARTTRPRETGRAAAIAATSLPQRRRSHRRATRIFYRFVRMTFADM